MAGGNYTTDDDRAITDAVRAGARRDRDFREVALRLGRSAEAVRERALRLGLIERAARAGAPARPWSDSEISFLLKARSRKTPQREIAKILQRTVNSVGKQLAVLEGRVIQRPQAREYAVEREQNREVQARACERHAAACLAAGGFWALSERRLGRDQVAVCLPLVPPVQMRGAPR